MTLIKDITLVLFLSAAAASDIRYARIGNGMITAGILCGLAGSASGAGPPGPAASPAGSLAGMAVPLILLGPLYLFRMIGAGDIKLLILTGSFKGPVFTFKTLILSFLIGSVISIALLIRRGNLYSRFHYLAEYISETKSARYPKPYLNGVGADGRFCFSVPILAAAVTLLTH